ncbi:MAG TPA: hypothetical protein VGE88_14100 [Lysobacter sp.]
MDRISSSSTFFTKKVFPCLWFGIVGAVLISMIVGGAWRRSPVVLLHPLLMAGIGYIVFRKLIGGLADEVRDGGAFLLVRMGGVEERVQLSNVMNVDITQYQNPSRITLRLRTPGKLGDEVSFIPQSSFQLNPFARNRIAEALIQRVDRARMNS